MLLLAWIGLSGLLESRVHAQQNCSPCDAGLTAEAGAIVFGAFNCSEFVAEAAWDTSDSEMCALNRMAAVAFCGCETPTVTETCDLCPNGSIDVDLTRELPDVPGVTCGDILNVSKVDGDETCDLLQYKYAFWCGCPKAKPTCTLCPSGAFPPKPNKALPFNSNLLCGDIATELLVSTPSQCAGLRSDIPVDLASYCECPNTQPPEICTFCPGGMAVDEYVIVDNDLTCGDVNQIARFSTNQTVCEIMASVKDQCCSGSIATDAQQHSTAASSTINPLGQRLPWLAIALTIVLFSK